jgi:cytosine/adenosine deaminase-related metal-dependent hydrolase
LVPVVIGAVGAFTHQRTVFRAGWVLAIAQPPIRDGWVAVEGGRILGVGGPGTLPSSVAPDRRFREHVILPGLVNAHTHLELSWMREQVPSASSMPQWVATLMALRRTVGLEPPLPIREAIDEARAAGTALVGDITNTLAAYEPLAVSGMSGAIFRELLGFTVQDADAVLAATRAQIAELRPYSKLRPSIVPHAPYSVSSTLLRAIADAAGDSRISIHLGESAEEVEFLRAGSGAWRELLSTLGVWSDEWQAPGTGPVAYLAAHGLLNERLLAVHCVQLTDEELRLLAAAGATVVTCPRSNQWTGAGLPPIDRFYASGVRVAVGTDSLASVEDLNLFEELKLMRQLAPAVPAREILTSATKSGADALGFGDELGTIEPGKRAELIAVRVPAATTDVEEYLLSGVAPRDIQWVD